MTLSADRSGARYASEPQAVHQMRKACAFACIFAVHAVAHIPAQFFWGLPIGWTDFATVGFDLLMATGFYAAVYHYWYGNGACIAIRLAKPNAMLSSQVAGFAVMGVILAAWIHIVPKLSGVKPGFAGNLLILGAMVFAGYHLIMAINRKILKFE